VTKPNSPVPPDSDPSARDDALLSFLRTYQPAVPQIGSDAEETLMQAITHPPAPKTLRGKGRLRILLGVGLGVGIVAGIGQVGRWFLPQPSVGDLASLESFLVDTWDSSAEPIETLSEWDWLLRERPSARRMSSIVDSHLPIDLER
jgi:hypothetical protein